MKEKLKYEWAAPYLPYNVNIVYRVLDLKNGDPTTDNPDDRLKDCLMIMDGSRLDNCLYPEGHRWYRKNAEFKLVLRPLPDLITHSVFYSCLEAMFSHEKINKMIGEHYSHWDYKVILLCLENHIDIFGLLDKDLAVPYSNYMQKDIKEEN
jgi:hypothetical protein